MIQLYKASNTNFDFNGDFNLALAEECYIEAEINKTWKLTLIYPRIDDDETFNEIKPDAVIKTKTWMTDEQLYRIYDIEKTDDEVAAYARPIFMDAKNDAFITSLSIANQTGQGALDKILSVNSKYSGESDITIQGTTEYMNINSIEAIASDDDTSFLSIYGGEILYDNFKIIINESCGKDRGASVKFGKNMTGIEADIDYDDVGTRIVPLGDDDVGIFSGTPYVDSENINKYSTIKYKVVKYSDVKLAANSSSGEGYSTESEYDAELRRRAQLEFDAGADLPTITYDISMVDLSNYDEYSDIADLEKIYLGDTVKCYNENLDISTSAKVIYLNYDCIKNENTEIKLGDYQPNFMYDISSDISSLFENVDTDGNLKASAISGVINLMKTKLEASRAIAEKQQERAILFEDNDPDSDTYGAMSLGTTGFQIASKKDTTGDWIWSTFGTGEGFYANLIIAGLLTDKLGKNSWNLDTGEFTITKGSLKISADSDANYIQVQTGESGKVYRISIRPSEITVYDQQHNRDAFINAYGFNAAEGTSNSNYGVNADIVGTLDVDGTATFDGTVNANEGINVYKSITAGGLTGASGTLKDSNGTMIAVVTKGIITSLIY